MLPNLREGEGLLTAVANLFMSARIGEMTFRNHCHLRTGLNEATNVVFHPDGKATKFMSL